MIASLTGITSCPLLHHRSPPILPTRATITPASTCRTSLISHHPASCRKSLYCFATNANPPSTDLLARCWLCHAALSPIADLRNSIDLSPAVVGPRAGSRGICSSPLVSLSPHQFCGDFDFAIIRHLRFICRSRSKVARHFAMPAAFTLAACFACNTASLSLVSLTSRR